MLHDGRLSGAGATILIPIDRYPQVFSTTHFVILPCVHSYLIVLFPYLRILSPLEDVLYPLPLHTNIMSLGIYLQVDAESLAASPHYSGVTTSTHTTRHRAHAL
jgi:hypothetical protein